MSQQQHDGGSHGPSWYKVFSVVLAILYLMFMLVASQCAFSLESPELALNTALCIAYYVLTIVCFILGMMVALVGIEHAKRHSKSRYFYYGSLIYFVVLATIFIYSKFL